MSDLTVLEVLDKLQARLEGHFRLSSGRHAKEYFQCAKLFERTDTPYPSEICQNLVDLVTSEGIDPQAVVGPALGAVNMTFLMGQLLGVPNVFTESVDGKMLLRRGFQIIPGRRYLAVEDVTTTGGSIKKSMKIVADAGGIVVAVACVLDRSNGAIQFAGGIPHFAAHRMEVVSWAPDECPICQKGIIPLEKPGSGKFLSPSQGAGPSSEETSSLKSLAA